MLASPFTAPPVAPSFTGLPGEASTDNPDFIMMGVLNRLSITALFEMAAVAGRSDERTQSATVCFLYPSDKITYPDGAPARPVAVMVSSGKDNWFNGVSLGFAPAPSELHEADWLLPYFYTESLLANAGTPLGQPTTFRAFAGNPAAAIHKGRKLFGCLMSWSQLADEVAMDAREGQPSHPVFSMLRPPPIVTYRRVSELSMVGEVADPKAQPPGPLDTLFIDAIKTLLDTDAPFYAHQAAQEAGISNSLARFFLRRLASRGHVGTATSNR